MSQKIHWQASFCIEVSHITRLFETFSSAAVQEKIKFMQKYFLK
jgi:hypothetical protein